MKRTYNICWLIYLFFNIVETALAQTEKGSQLVGVQVGNVVLSRKENLGSAVVLKPAYGVFISDGLAVGVGVPFYHFSNNNPAYPIKVTQFGITPFARYYIGSNVIKPFLSASGGIERTYIKENSVKNAPRNSLLYSLGGGVALFFNESISFDVGVNYTGVNNKDYYTFEGYAQNSLTTGFANAININIGFQFYFGGD